MKPISYEHICKMYETLKEIAEICPYPYDEWDEAEGLHEARALAKDLLAEIHKEQADYEAMKTRIIILEPVEKKDE